MLWIVIALLILLIVLLLLVGDRIVQIGDRIVTTQTEIKNLKSELLIRLPPRPFGVDSDIEPELTNGPNDKRIRS